MALENVIEWIFNNIFFVFIIIGGIISFLKRLKAADVQPSKPVKRPSFSGKERETEFHSEQKPNFSSMETVRLERSEPQTNLQNAEQKLYQFKDQVERMSSLKSVNQSPHKRVIKKNMFKNPSKNKLREGIIWAEVLGAPRAHKPYGRENYRRTKG